MATSAIRPFADGRPALSVSRLLLSGAVTAVVIFVLCWIGTFIPFSSPAHSYIGLFTTADLNSGRALIEGTFWSLLFGGLAAALFGFVYNSVAGIARR